MKLCVVVSLEPTLPHMTSTCFCFVLVSPPERGTTYKYLIGAKYNILRTMDSIGQIVHYGSWQPHLFVPVLVKADDPHPKHLNKPFTGWELGIDHFTRCYVHQSQFVQMFLNLNKLEVPVLVKAGAHIQKHLNKPFTGWKLGRLRTGHPPFHKMLCPQSQFVEMI